MLAETVIEKSVVNVVVTPNTPTPYNYDLLWFLAIPVVCILCSLLVCIVGIIVWLVRRRKYKKEKKPQQEEEMEQIQVVFKSVV